MHIRGLERQIKVKIADQNAFLGNIAWKNVYTRQAAYEKGDVRRNSDESSCKLIRKFKVDGTIQQTESEIVEMRN